MAKNSLIVLFCLIFVACSSAPKFSGPVGKVHLKLETPNDPLDLVFVDLKTRAKIELNDQSGDVNIELPEGTYFLEQIRHSGQTAEVASDVALQFDVTASQTLELGSAFDSCADWNDSQAKTARFKTLAVDQHQWNQSFQYGKCLLFWANPKQALSSKATTETPIQSSICDDAKHVVADFIKKDSAGFWLKPNPEIKKYVVGEVGSFESTVAILSASVVSCRYDGANAQMTVEYDVKGLPGKRSFKKQEVFEIILTNDGPRIQASSLPVPHVLKK